MMLMIFASMLQQRLQKFLVLATKSGKSLGIAEIIDMLIGINSFTNHKTLCKGMQDCLEKIFHVRQCVVLFKDTRKNQFFNVVFAEEQDRENTFQANLEHRRELVKKMKSEGRLKDA